MRIERLEALGFDSCHEVEKGIQIGCTQCSAIVIQGTPCHEYGCPNEMHECKGCNAIVPKGAKYCEDCR